MQLYCNYTLQFQFSFWTSATLEINGSHSPLRNQKMWTDKHNNGYLSASYNYNYTYM